MKWDNSGSPEQPSEALAVSDFRCMDSGQECQRDYGLNSEKDKYQYFPPLYMIHVTDYEVKANSIQSL